MTPIDNSGFLNMCYNCGSAGFAPSIGYSFDTATKILTVTNKSVYAAGDSLKVVNIYVSDRFGNIKTTQIKTGKGSAKDVAVDLTTGFDASIGFNIQATIVTDKRMLADLSAYDVASATGANAGDLSHIDIGF